MKLLPSDRESNPILPRMVPLSLPKESSSLVALESRLGILPYEYPLTFSLYVYSRAYSFHMRKCHQMKETLYL